MEPQDRRPSIVPDFVKKALQGGVHAVVGSEEGLRGALSDLFPKELTDYVKKVVDAAKAEGLNMVAQQTREFLERLDVETLVRHVVDNYTIHVHLDLDLEPKKVRTSRAGGATRAKGSPQPESPEKPADNP
jgi:hypothetical protein